MLQGPPARRDAPGGVDEAAAAFGLRPEQVDGPGGLNCTDDAAPPGCELWPEHAGPVGLFARMAGQWRMGPGGPVALDYTALPVVARLLRLGRRALREAFEPLRVMEAEALAWFAEQQQG